MTPGENKLRAALRQTAGEIGDDPPPLDLSRAPASRPRTHRDHVSRDHASRRWIAWAAPLAAAAMVVAVVAGSLAVTGRMPHPRASTPAADFSGVPPYYVALTSPSANPGPYDPDATAAEVRATATGAVLARIAVPKPYTVFSGVTAAAGDRTFVLIAEGANGTYQPAFRFYLLRIGPAAARVSLRVLPDGFIPAYSGVQDMALSPDGTLLAADLSGVAGGTELFVFNLATGTRRAWSYRSCSRCDPTSGGLGLAGVNVGALSWTADGRHLAFVAPGTVSGPGPVGPGAASYTPGSVRLLDVSAPGANLLADSKVVLKWPGGAQARPSPAWRGAVITPDGRTVVFLEQLETYGTNGALKSVRWRLAKGSAATGQVTAVLPNLKPVGQYEQVMYTNAIGHDLVVYYFGLGYGTHVGILHGSQFTPIKWSPYIITAAW
jgi:hypothetical protein